jgi:hypothetical protein
MRSPLLALSWELVARRRWTLPLASALVVVLPLVAWLCGAQPTNVLGMGVVLLLYPGIIFIADLCLGNDGPLEGRASVFPRRLFRLPVPAWVLVAPPLLLGTCALALGGAILTLTIPRLLNENSPGLWPGLLAAVCVAWLQALCWSPFPLPWLRLAALSFLLPAVVGSVIAFSCLPAGVPEIVLLPLLALAYFVAHRGVRLARSGVGLEEPAFQHGGESIPEGALAAPRAWKPFAAAFDAQLWLEWRQAWPGLVILGVALLWVVPVMLMLPITLEKLDGLPGVKSTVDAVGVGWLVAAVALLAPLYTALCLGPSLGRLRWQRERSEMSSFLSSKPIDNQTLLRVKFWFLAWIMAGASALAWLVTLLSSLATGRVAEMAERLSYWCGGPAVAVLALVGGLLGMAALGWLWMAGGLWGGLWGKWWPVGTALLTSVTFATTPVTGHVWLAAPAVLINAAFMVPLIQRSRLWPLIAGLILATATSALVGWWPVAVLLWPWPGLLIAPVAIDCNRHR